MPAEGAFKLDGVDAARFLASLDPGDQAEAVVLVALPVETLRQAAARVQSYDDEQARRIHAALLGVRGVKAPDPANGG